MRKNLASKLCTNSFLSISEFEAKPVYGYNPDSL